MADIREIADFSAPELDIFARLRDSQLANWECAEQGVFIAESPKVIARALQSGYEPISFLMERRHLENQAKSLLERCPEVPVFTAEEPVLAQMTGFHLTRGMLCAMKRRTLPQVEQVCANARRVAVLERVMNPTNVGAIFRSAAALGMDAVLLTPECSDPLYRRSTRVSMGTVFQIPWTYLPEGSWTEKLHALGFRTAAMALRADSVRLNDPRPDARIKRIALDINEDFCRTYKNTGFKGMVATNYKRDAVRYLECFEQFGDLNCAVVISAPDLRESVDDADEGADDKVVAYWNRMMTLPFSLSTTRSLTLTVFLGIFASAFSSLTAALSALRTTRSSSGRARSSSVKISLGERFAIFITS